MDGTDKSKCTLYVPEGTEQLYANADGWKEFGMIIPSLKTSVPSTKADGEWRALPSSGKLIVDSTSDHEIHIMSTSGNLLRTVTIKGRTEIVLPQGIYIVSPNGKSTKVRI